MQEDAELTKSVLIRVYKLGDILIITFFFKYTAAINCFVEISPDGFQAQLHTNFPDLTAQKKEEQDENFWQMLCTSS